MKRQRIIDFLDTSARFMLNKLLEIAFKSILLLIKKSCLQTFMESWKRCSPRIVSQFIEIPVVFSIFHSLYFRFSWNWYFFLSFWYATRFLGLRRIWTMWYHFRMQSIMKDGLSWRLPMRSKIRLYSGWVVLPRAVTRPMSLARMCIRYQPPT